MRIAKSAGQKLVWFAFFPVLRELMIIKIAKKKWWWILLALVPVLNIWVSWTIWSIISKSIGRSVWWGRSMIIPFFNIFALAVMGFNLNPKACPPIILAWIKTIIGKIKTRLEKKQKASV